MKKETKLKAEYAAKFDKICDLVSQKLGYGERANVSEEDRRLVVEEAEELVENWDMAVLEDWDLVPKAKLQKLLAEHHELGEQLLDLQHTAAFRKFGGDT